MKTSKSILALLIAAAVSVNAQNGSTARFNSYCGLLQDRIYCYGGSDGTVDKPIEDTTMFVLDITQANGSSMSDLQNNWKVDTTNVYGVNTEKRRNSMSAVVGGNQLVISGGFGGVGTAVSIVNQTIAFNVETKSWKSYPNYMEGTINRQIYWAATTEVPSKGLAFYGGFEYNIDPAWTFPTNQNISATVFNNGISRVIGYTGVTYLDITNVDNPWSAPPQTNVPSAFSTFQTSIFDPVTKKIFFFGGIYEDTLTPNYYPLAYRTWHKFSYALTFDTTNGAWGNETLKGDIIPSERRYHTVTLLPNGESTVLLYGGEYLAPSSDSAKPNQDYCFTLDLKTLTWMKQSISANFVDLLRCRHSSIVVDKDTLFIVNGLNTLNTLVDVPLVLNISNPASISYVEKYTSPLLLTDKDDPNVEVGKVGESKLSSGAIAGIAIGAAVGIILAIAGAIFWFRKKRNSEQATNMEEDAAPIEVNWDEIDKQYEEIPVIKGYPLNPSLGNTSPKSIPKSSPKYSPDEPKDEFTVIGSPGQSSDITYSSPNIKSEVYRQKPDGGNF